MTDFICKTCRKCDSIWAKSDGHLSIMCKSKERHAEHSCEDILIFCREYSAEKTASKPSNAVETAEPEAEADAVPEETSKPDAVPKKKKGEKKKNKEPAPSAEEIKEEAPADEDKRAEDVPVTNPSSIADFFGFAPQSSGTPKPKEEKKACCATCSNALKAERGYTCKISCESVNPRQLCYKYKNGTPVGF